MILYLKKKSIISNTYEVEKRDDRLLENELDGTEALIINCADKPTVDITSTWVGEYAMKHNIAHIVGGGYNLYLSLIGQTLIPGEIACIKCYEKQLEKLNEIDVSSIKRLEVKNRKIGKASNFFRDYSRIYQKLECLIEIGLEYIKLGQLSMSLSGGEAQRIKLGKYLGENIKSNKNIYLRIILLKI